MSHFAPLPTPNLPETIKKTIDELLGVAPSSFGRDLRSIVLYGSAAEGALRPTSDINVILVLRTFEPAQVERIRPTLRFAQSAIQLNAMFLLSDELPAAVRSFAPKFADVLRRRVILFGEDPFAVLSVPRDAEIRQLRQGLLNATLRMRSVYATRGAREEQLAIFLARVVGPIRKLSQSFLRLQEQDTKSPRDAFARVGEEMRVPGWGETAQAVEGIEVSPVTHAGTVSKVFLEVLACVQKMREKAETIGGG